jgi:uncharacterized repeat protein (TIGR01451 family)
MLTIRTHSISGRRALVAALLISGLAALLGASSPRAATDEGADIAILDLSGERAAVGSSYTFAYAIDNKGPETAPEVHFTAALGGSFVFGSASSGQGTCAYTPQSRTVGCDVGVLPQGASVTIELVVTPSSGVDSTATVSSAPGGDPEVSNNSARSAPQLLPAGSADLWVYPNSGLGDEGVGSAGYGVAGQPFGYSIDVVNYGPAVAEDVMLSVVLPAGVQFVSAETDCTGVEDEDSTTTVTCPLGRVEKGRTVALTALAPVETAGQTLRTEVFVDGSGLDPGPAPNNSANLLTVVPGISARNASSGEGTRFVRVPVELSAPVEGTVTVDYATSGGTAKAGGDYRPAQGTLTFSPGQTEQLVSIPIIQDRKSERNETVALDLSTIAGSASAAGVGSTIPGAALVRPRGTATILDDDPRIRIANARAVERDASARNITFRIALSHASPSPVTARFATADASARAGADYVAHHTSIRFRPGQRTQSVTVRIKGDRKHERNERFLGKLSRVRGALVADGGARATIIDND